RHMRCYLRSRRDKQEVFLVYLRRRYMQKNVSRNLTAVALIGTLALVGCANMSETQRGTAVGAGTGAGLGAIIGAVAGGGRGAAGGAVLGGAAGAIVGNVWSS